MGKYSFNGSKIDKSCSYSKLLKALEANNQNSVRVKYILLLLVVSVHQKCRLSFLELLLSYGVGDGIRAS